MKNIWFGFPLLLAILVSSSCNSGKVKTLEREKSALQLELSRKAATIEMLLQSVNDIEQNLIQIRSRENLISGTASDDAEMKQDARKRVIAEISAINTLMDENRQTMARLNKALRTSGVSIDGLETTVSLLNTRVLEKEHTVAELKRQLIQLNFMMDHLNAGLDSLTAQNMLQQEQITAQEEALNRVWYAVGSANELQKHKIVNKKGGFLGVGGRFEVNNSFDEHYFTPIDKRNLISIPLGARSAKLLTPHNTTCYHFEKEDRNITALVIDDLAGFWKRSDYLVILLK